MTSMEQPGDPAENHEQVSDSVLYFGFGANADPEMIGAIIGRVPEGAPAELRDHQLVVQQPHHLTDSVKQTLEGNWSEEELDRFESYAVRPQEGHAVEGVAWKVSSQEREFISNWEFWYKKAEVSVHDLGETAIGPVQATTEVLHDDHDAVPAHELYEQPPTFVVPKERLIEVAVKARAEYLARQAETGNGS